MNSNVSIRQVIQLNNISNMIQEYNENKEDSTDGVEHLESSLPSDLCRLSELEEGECYLIIPTEKFLKLYEIDSSYETLAFCHGFNNALVIFNGRKDVTFNTRSAGQIHFESYSFHILAAPNASGEVKQGADVGMPPLHSFFNFKKL